MKRFLLFISILFSFAASSQVIKAYPNHRPVSAGGGGCGPDVVIGYSAGTNFAADGNFWKSANGTSGFCVYTAGSLPAGEAGYYYAEVRGGDSAKGNVLMVSYTDTVICPPTDGWNTSIRFAVFPNEGSTFYRVWDGFTETFTVTAVTYQTGDKYGIFRSAGGVVTAQYYRAGVWTVMHSFSANSTVTLYLGGSGFEWSYLAVPTASCNFQSLL